MDHDPVLAAFAPGLSVYLQAAVGEPLALRQILAQSPAALRGVAITGCFLPGINTFDYAALSDGVRLTTFMLPPSMRPSFDQGRIRLVPLPYSQIAAALATGPPFDLVIAQVSPPDDAGACSLGPCADFIPMVWPRARRRLAFVNPDLPRATRGPNVPFSTIDIAIDAPGAFISAGEGAPSPAQASIARTIAALIPDGAAIQSGIGGAPAAAIHALSGHRGLIVRSGMVTPGYRVLAEAGALAPDAEHITGLAMGEERFIHWACETLTFADATVTHGAAALARAGRFFAINSALEVDLFGQANLEWRDGAAVSGLGGAPDFARAARASSGGRAILALPATTERGTRSRIVARLTSPTVSLPRHDTDLVVTEYGTADLRDAGLEARAEALIAIAAPAFRDALADEWRQIRRGL